MANSGKSKKSAESRNPRTGDQEYEVGYQKTPFHTRFQKGQSGNPKGRPKKSRNLKTAVTRELNATLEIVENGKRKKISKREALVKNLYAQAMKKDIRAASLLVSMDERFVGIDTPDDAAIFHNTDYQAIVEDFLTQQRAPEASANDGDDNDEGDSL